MDNILQIVRQEAIEERYNRKHIDKKIRQEIRDSDVMQAKQEHGVGLLTEWLAQSYYASKQARLDQLKQLELAPLVETVFVGVSYCQKPELFTSVSSQLACRLGFADHKAAITTAAEILAVLCTTDAFDIGKEHKMASLMVISRVPLSDELLGFIENSQYLPPMVCEPLELTDNYSSGYLTHKDSLILGAGNHHDGDICLDVLNTINRVALKLDLEFLCQCEEDPNSEFTVDNAIERAGKKGQTISKAQAMEIVQAQKDHWFRFKGQSYEFYKLMHKMGNEFYLTHKVDKRGRIYAQGYHISTQATAFKKASVELSKEEIVTGVPGE